MTTIIAKNQTAGALPLKQIPVANNEIPASGQVTLTDFATIAEIQGDVQLGGYITADQVLLNDGTRDLTKNESLNVLSPVISTESAPAVLKARAASTSNGTLASSFEAGDTLDGVTLAQGDLILLKDQSTGAENGVYVVQASGAPVRSPFLSTGANATNSQVSVSEGTVNAGELFVCTNVQGSDVVGTDALVYVSQVGAKTLIYEAVVPDDYALPSAAFADGAVSVFVRDGTYVETADVEIPPEGILAGASMGSAVIDLSGGDFAVTINGSGRSSTTGTIAGTHDSATITGTGTSFQTDLQDGDYILVGTGDRCWAQIGTISSETSLTLAAPWRGQTFSGVAMDGKSLSDSATIRDITIADNASGSGLEVINAYHAVVENVRVVGCGNLGATAPGGIFQDCVECSVQNLVAMNGPYDGVDFVTCQAMRMLDASVSGFDGKGVRCDFVQDFAITAVNVCGTGGYGISVENASDEVLIGNGSVVSETNSGGIQVLAGTGDCHVRNTTIRNCAGDALTLSGGFTNAANLQCSSNGGNGITSTGTSVISDCLIRGNGGNGIENSGDDVVIDGCFILSNTGNGIDIAAAADRTIVGNNLVNGNATDINDLSTTTIYDIQVAGAPTAGDVIVYDGTDNVWQAGRVVSTISSWTADTGRFRADVVHNLGSWTADTGRFRADVVHNLGTTDVKVETFLAASNETVIMDEVDRTDANTVRIWSLTNTENVRVVVSSGQGGGVVGGTDPDAIHDNVAGEITSVTEKVTPVAADVILIEDSADSNNKKRVQLGNLPAPNKVFRFPHTWAISGEIAVPSGDDDFIIPFFVSLVSGQTAELVKARHRINSGTSATVKLQRNDVDITGFTGISVTTTNTNTDPANVALSDDDKLALVVTGVSGSPTNLTFTIFIEYTQ